MKALFIYAVILGSGVAVGFYGHGPLSLYVVGPLKLGDVAKLNWLHGVEVIIEKALAPAMPEAAVIPVDPASAALIDEELDYRIAQRVASLDGWRSFLAAHASGVHAQAAESEVERLLVAARAPAPAAAEVSSGASPDAKTATRAAGSAPSSHGTEVAALTPEEICISEGDRVGRPRGSPASDAEQRFANELGCGKPRPQLLGLMDSLGYASPTQAAAPPSPIAKVGSVLGPKRRAVAPESETRWMAPWRGLQPKRHANRCAFRCYWRASPMPPILLALLGDRPSRWSTFRHMVTYARPHELHGR